MHIACATERWRKSTDKSTDTHSSLDMGVFVLFFRPFLDMGVFVLFRPFRPF